MHYGYSQLSINELHSLIKKSENPKVSQVESENLMAWSHKIIFFNETSLAKTAKTLEDWYDVDIGLENGALKNLKIIYKSPKNILMRKKNKQEIC